MKTKIINLWGIWYVVSEDFEPRTVANPQGAGIRWQPGFSSRRAAQRAKQIVDARHGQPTDPRDP